MVEVFRTNVTRTKDARKITRILNKVLPGYRISFDLQDCDKVLRIETKEKNLDVTKVLLLMRREGFSAEVLPDEPGDKPKSQFNFSFLKEFNFTLYNCN